MHFSLAELAEACDGRVLSATAAGAPRATRLLVDGVGIDSRNLVAGQLFVPVVAERDGHDFLPAALHAGAGAYLTSRPELSPDALGAQGAVLVADTAVALAALGAAARRRLEERVLAVTGSVGKTSVKDFTAAALRSTFRTAASWRSFNNELGVPLTLLNSPDDTEAVVVEMGARGEGHIAALCAIARPTIAILTRVAPAHLELFGSVEAVARAKGELVEALPGSPRGVAVLNSDDALVLDMASRTAATVLTYGHNADVRAERVSLDELARARFTAVTPWGAGPVQLAVSGMHMVGNALAAIGAALAAGAPLDAVLAGIESAPMSPWRMELGVTAKGVTVLNDAYNASPVAVHAAFDALLALGERGRGRRIAVLGLMAELGTSARQEHHLIAQSAAQRGIQLHTVGTDLYGHEAGRHWADIAAVHEALIEMDLGPHDVVLVKASRVVGLERLVTLLGVTPLGG